VIRSSENELVPDIIHCNDWQTGLIPLFLKDNYSWDEKFAKTASVMTIHNIGYQGRFPKESLYKAEINPDLFYENSPIEVWGSVCFLKAGLMYADVITTVSKTYAKEVMTPHLAKGLTCPSVPEGTISADSYGVIIPYGCFEG
jgi:starch synthase